jgi:alpha-glucoside transport system substrate-binding protein
VSVLGTWGGAEQDSFMAMVAPFTTATGINVEYTGTRDLNAVLTTRVQGGNPPELAGLPGPGQMAQFAQQNRLVDLGTILDTQTYRANYDPSWIQLGTSNNKLVGVFIKAAVKGLIWYNPKVWQANGFQPPRTWDEMTALMQRMSATGTTPWCVGLESGATSGWPGTDWIEDFVLRQSGADVYNRWWDGQITWSSPEIRRAWEAFGQVVGDPKMVFGGANSMLTTNFGTSGDPLFRNPPGCFMHHQASFITDFFVQNNPNVKPGEDFDFFPFPTINPNNAGANEVAGDLFGMFRDTPQSRALIKYLVSPEAQAIWVRRGGAISPNKAVPASIYPDPLSQKSAQLLTSTRVAVFDGSDLMPEAMNSAFTRAILDFVQAPNNLDGILRNLDQVQRSAYRR